MPRFSLTWSKRGSYASVRQKPVPKESHMLRLHRPEAKNPLVVTSLALGGFEPVPYGLIRAPNSWAPFSLLLPRAPLYSSTLSLLSSLSRHSLVSLPAITFLRRCHQLPPQSRSSSPIWLALFALQRSFNGGCSGSREQEVQRLWRWLVWWSEHL